MPLISLPPLASLDGFKSRTLTDFFAAFFFAGIFFSFLSVYFVKTLSTLIASLITIRAIRVLSTGIGDFDHARTRISLCTGETFEAGEKIFDALNAVRS